MSLEEAERHFLEGIPVEGDALFGLLAKQTKILDGEEIKADSGQAVDLLSSIKLSAAYLVQSS